jgi:hypothetical protein
MTSAAPGSAQGLYLIVSDIEAARDELVRHGVKVSQVFQAGTPGAQFRPEGTSGRVSGPAPDHESYRSFATFSDPDGNSWLLQEVTTRLPGRVEAAETAFTSASDLASALRRAEAAHGEHEKRTGQRDENWPDWYAGYMVAEQAREATSMKAVPRRLLILGGGSAGVELAQVVRRLGGEAVLIEGAGRVLPREPAPLGEALGEALRRDGIELMLGKHAAAARRDGEEYVLAFDGGPELRGDRLLVATGRRPRVAGIGLETVGVAAGPHGIRVDEYLRAGDRLWGSGTSPASGR